MISAEQVEELPGTTLTDPEGSKLGTIEEIYLEETSARPVWASVSSGMIMKRHKLVPLARAEFDGATLTVPYDKDLIKDAPDIETDGGHISAAQERQLYRHYGIFGAEGTPDPQASIGYDQDAMTRSEEHLQVATEIHEAGRARLRKYVVTENVTTTVPVRHEEVRVDREPITEANRDAALSGQPITQAEHEVVLHAERPVVSVTTEPVERVRLRTDTVEETEEVSRDIRKERIDLEELPLSDDEGR